MFTDLEKNKEMLLGAYKKTKSYYHYNKNFVFMKQKIAELEYDNEQLNQTLEKLANILAAPNNPENENILEEWLNKVDFYVMPKAFVSGNESSNLFVTSDLKESKAVNKVNFFIDLPIEMYLLDTLWTVLLGKLVFEKNIIGPESYGNSINNYVLYNREEDFLSSINFSKNNLFKIYFPQYCNWKNDAISTIESYCNTKSQLMFSLDIKGFYYATLWKFTILDKWFADDKRYDAMKPITIIIQKMYERYTRIIQEYREIKQNLEEKEYVLPIGLFSSMLLANIYLSDFDQKISANKKVLFYGRYVDDMIVVMDVTGDEEEVNYKKAFDKYLVEENSILELVEDGKYMLSEYPSLYIQKNKVKMIYFIKGESRTLINQLQKTLTYPSQMNIIPDTELRLTDFEEAAYSKMHISSETKIRDIGQMEIDKFQLGWHMSQIVLNSRIRKQYITKEERIRREEEGISILKFFTGSKALEYSNNWINAMYYFFLTSDINGSAWKKFENNIRTAISSMSIYQIEDLKKGKSRTIKAKLIKNLNQHFNICTATVLALHPGFSKREKKEINELALKLRQANLFNHYLVSYPLINYSDKIGEECDLTQITPEYIKDADLLIHKSVKSKLSPRFINLDEIFQYVFLIQATKGGNYYLDSEKYTAQKKLLYIENYFYEVNQISRKSNSHVAITINNENKEGYILQNIQLGDTTTRKEKARIAIANVKLDTRRCCFGLPCAKNVILNRLDLIRFMEKAYVDAESKVDFLVFPEFYMPLQWLSDVLAFVRKSGITVISGLQYVTCEKQAYNNVALFAPVRTGKYRSATLLVREKNDYAPMEREVLAIEKYKCVDQINPVYQLVKNNGIEYGIFLCYELTDIAARCLYKDKVDILFAPEHNRDTSYFSNIIETTARDLHVFIAQANTSIYGDSRITGPYGRNDRNVVQIKGGDEDDVIIGTIELEKVRKYQRREKIEFEKKINKYLRMKSAGKYKMEKEIFGHQDCKIAKTSARFSRNRS